MTWAHSRRACCLCAGFQTKKPSRMRSPESGCLVTQVLNSVVLCCQRMEFTAWGPLTGLPPHTRATPSDFKRAPLHTIPCLYSDTNTPHLKPPGGLGAASTPDLRTQSWVEARFLTLTRSVTLLKFWPSQSLPSLCIYNVGSFWHLFLGTL